MTALAEADVVAREVAEINTRLDEVDDPRECYRLVRQRIAEHKSKGEIVPDDLALLEKSLLAECNAASQGR